MKTHKKNKMITNILLFILLFLRIFPTVMDLIYGRFVLNKTAIPSWLDPLGRIAASFYLIYAVCALVPLTIIIILNRDNLQSLNVDKVFIFFFLFSGSAIFYAYFFPFGWLTGITTIFVFVYFVKGHLKFEDPSPLVLKISIWAGGAFIIGGMFIFNSLTALKVQNVLELLFVRTIPGAVYEEMIYRGILWRFLKESGLSETKVFLFSSILFWISHVSYLLVDPFAFWFTVPITSIVLGLMVWRSKSITPGIVTHILINILLGLIEL